MAVRRSTLPEVVRLESRLAELEFAAQDIERLSGATQLTLRIESDTCSDIAIAVKGTGVRDKVIRALRDIIDAERSSIGNCLAARGISMD